MAIKRIKPLKPKPVATPQCCVPFDETAYSDSYRNRRTAHCRAMGWDPAKCKRPSSYRIDGKSYCTQHAGQIALHVLTQESK